VTRTAVAVLTALVVGGLGAFAAPAAAVSTPARPAQAPPDVAACHDGTCTLTVSGPVEIPLDGRAGFTALSVLDVRPFAVTFAVQRTSGVGFGAVGAGGVSRFGSGAGTLAVQVLEISGGTARLEITTTTP
jgi:hypothetical protein